MPNLRRSLQNKNNAGGLSPTRNHATTALEPPLKVIKALYDFNTQQPEEMSFAKGDFFHVIGNEDDEDWYEAYNPVSGARGYVPVAYFQVLEKTRQKQPQQPQQQRGQRNSSQSIEDTGNDSGTFMDPLPNQYYSQHSPQQQHHHPQQYPQHGHAHPTSGHLPQGGSMISSSISSPVMSQKSAASSTTTKYQPLYGIVLYDFSAERQDELDCKTGDAILVMAQSNEDWYVAKPIGRLGRPGLIPVNFIEIRDMVSGKPINVPEMLRQTGMVIPRVDEWKKQEMEYKANSIPLGRIDAGMNRAPQQQQQQQQQHQSFIPPPSQVSQQQSALPKNNTQNFRDQGARKNHSQDLDTGRRMEGSNGRASAARSYSHDIYEDQTDSRYHHNRSFSNSSNPASRIVHATVESFHHEDDQYWYSVRVELASGATRSLFRLYDDFYNFHIALLEEFPVESGRVGDQPRILPFMPIPVAVVTDTVSASRRADLDGYVQDLCRLPTRITQHPLVEQLFAVRDGDSETPAESGVTGAARSTSPVQGRNTYRDQASPTLGAVGTGGQRATALSPTLRTQSQFPQPTLPTPAGTPSDMIKVKISYQEDIMAMRIPVTISFNALQQKIFDRLQTENKNLSYRDDRGDFAIVQTDADVRDAIDQSGGKLMIYVN
ncbi:bud emergence protein 1 [Mortierella sp. AD011]|nr:bud emergence protein 1 [Mortierella sp. AD010]KAF9399453.1 bud emergence protein 1 [Mortierella sp. AD011]